MSTLFFSADVAQGVVLLPRLPEGALEVSQEILRREARGDGVSPCEEVGCSFCAAKFYFFRTPLTVADFESCLSYV